MFAAKFSKRKYFKRDHVAVNQRMIDDYFVNQPTYDKQCFVSDFGCENMFFSRSLETYQAETTTSPNKFTQKIKKTYLH